MELRVNGSRSHQACKAVRMTPGFPRERALHLLPSLRAPRLLPLDIRGDSRNRAKPCPAHTSLSAVARSGLRQYAALIVGYG